jgi:hypothetical protein
VVNGQQQIMTARVDGGCKMMRMQMIMVPEACQVEHREECRGSHKRQFERTGATYYCLLRLFLVGGIAAAFGLEHPPNHRLLALAKTGSRRPLEWNHQTTTCSCLRQEE